MSMLFKRIKDWAVSITSFRTGDVIPVDGPDGTAKMSINSLLADISKESRAGNLGIATSVERTASSTYYASYNMWFLKGHKYILRKVNDSDPVNWGINNNVLTISGNTNSYTYEPSQDVFGQVFAYYASASSRTIRFTITDITLDSNFKREIARETLAGNIGIVCSKEITESSTYYAGFDIQFLKGHKYRLQKTNTDTPVNWGINGGILTISGSTNSYIYKPSQDEFGQIFAYYASASSRTIKFLVTDITQTSEIFADLTSYREISLNQTGTYFAIGDVHLVPGKVYEISYDTTTDLTAIGGNWGIADTVTKDLSIKKFLYRTDSELKKDVFIWLATSSTINVKICVRDVTADNVVFYEKKYSSMLSDFSRRNYGYSYGVGTKIDMAMSAGSTFKNTDDSKTYHKNRAGLWVDDDNNQILLNPIIKGQNPDATWIFDGAKYVMCSTGYPCILMQSSDFIHWHPVGSLLSADSIYTSAIWAPSLHKIGTKYVAYVSVNGENIPEPRNILVLTSDNANGPYVEQGVLGITNIDPCYCDGYLFYGNGHIYSYQMSADGLSKIGSQIDTGIGGVEGPYVTKIGDYYYMFCSTTSGPTVYDVHVYRSSAITGPWEDGGVILFGTYNVDDICGSGHVGNILIDNDGRMFLNMHALLKGYEYFEQAGWYGYRQQIIQELRINASDWPEFVDIDGNVTTKPQLRVRKPNI